MRRFFLVARRAAAEGGRLAQLRAKSVHVLRYRCSRCGQIKANHICPFLVADSVACGVQADPTVTVTTAGATVLYARPRPISAV